MKCGEPRRIRDRGRIRTTETSTFQPRSELSPSQIYLPPSSFFIRDRSRGRSTTLDRRVRGHFSIRRNFYLFLLFSFTLPSSMILSFSFFFLFFLAAPICSRAVPSNAANPRRPPNSYAFSSDFNPSRALLRKSSPTRSPSYPPELTSSITPVVGSLCSTNLSSPLFSSIFRHDFFFLFSL